MSYKFRGMLCNRCNVTLSNYNDDPTMLRAKADSLRKEADILISQITDSTLHFRLQKTIADQKLIRAEIIDGLAKYMECNIPT